jgi:ABC-type Na+ transport system ATPase subunit NatA
VRLLVLFGHVTEEISCSCDYLIVVKKADVLQEDIYAMHRCRGGLRTCEMGGMEADTEFARDHS